MSFVIIGFVDVKFWPSLKLILMISTRHNDKFVFLREETNLQVKEKLNTDLV